MNNIVLTDSDESISWKEIYPNVIVYSNMLKNPELAYDTMMESDSSSEGKHYFKKWDPWAQFGTYTQVKHGDELSLAESGDMLDKEKALVEEVTDAYNKALSHYIKYTGTQLPEGARYSGQSYCKYFNKIDTLKNNMTMQYHTDYIISQKDMPGEKFFITCTFYINDNYNGGDIEFYVNGNVVNHKPKAGDIVIFPSTEPYFHGVKTIPDGNKFFVRNFVMFDYDGSEEWLANQKKYGGYKWAKMEIERIEEEDKKNMVYLKDNTVISYSEAYQNG